MSLHGNWQKRELFWCNALYPKIYNEKFFGAGIHGTPTHSANLSPIALKLKEPGVNILESIFYSGHVTLARVGLIPPAAREAARRRQVAMRMEAQMKEERKAQWMASLQGPGWARRGRCHGL